MPRTCIDTADAVELAETLQLIADWLAADPAHGLDALRTDRDRFTFLFGGNDGESLLGEKLS
jgi:hypothetical protein